MLLRTEKLNSTRNFNLNTMLTRQPSRSNCNNFLKVELILSFSLFVTLTFLTKLSYTHMNHKNAGLIEKNVKIYDENEMKNIWKIL
jgi:hypothetical protein